MALDQLTPLPISPATPGGPNVAVYPDSNGLNHQGIVAEYLPASGADPVGVTPLNGLPVNFVAGGAAAGTVGVPSADVLTIQGATGMTPIQTSKALAVTTGGFYVNGVAPATPAVQTLKASGGNILQVIASNTNATNTVTAYMKFWDLSSPPTLGTTACTYQIPIPVPGINAPLANPRPHVNGIYMAITGGIGPTDNTAVAGSTIAYDVSGI